MNTNWDGSYLRDLIGPQFCNYFNDARILITGASGLMGIHFAELFQMCSRDYGGKVDLTLISQSGEYPFPIAKEVKTISLDLTSNDISKIDKKFDVIIHSAGYGQPRKFQSNALQTIHLNTATTIELSRLVDKSGSFLFLSSSEVYSGLLTPPFCEDSIGTTNTNHPRASYIESKRAGEVIMYVLGKEFTKLNASSARLALAYGPGVKQGDTRVMYELIRMALKENRIVLRDSGNAIRTYCFVSDAVRQSIAIIMNGNSDVFNVGGKSRITIRNLALLIGNMLNVDVEIPEDKERFLEDAPLDVWLDLTKVENLCSDFEYVDISTGLSKTISWIASL